ncbi:unnamed protein product [Mytilus edulis]|uniref:MULE transposase domain-containing protein n=1 Tax=Mytilus edulis TaxID=6550 RepID=A0A8S3U7D4_MYTED|nr:unnamed protein product [Mytilus edulis]
MPVMYIQESTYLFKPTGVLFLWKLFAFVPYVVSLQIALEFGCTDYLMTNSRDTTPPRLEHKHVSTFNVQPQSCLGHATSTGTVASTYHRFFSHLQCFLDDIPGAQISGKSLVFGSDEEKALTKAIQKCFPDSQQILCTRHIEESFKRHLREVIGEKDPNYNTVLNEVFGVDGLLSSPDDVEFDLKVMELEAKYEYSVPAFQRYFSSSTSSLKNYVWEPPQKDIAPINWKNNSCESMNNILKLSTNWKAPGPYRQTTQNCSITISRYTTSITWPGELCVGSLG